MGVKRHAGKWQVDIESAYVGVYEDESTANMAFQHGKYLRALGKPLPAVIRELRGSPDAPTLQQVYAEWYATLVVSDETRYRYKLNYARLNAPASKPVSDFNAADIRRMISGMSKRSYSPKTVHVSLSTLKSVLVFAADAGYIERVPPFRGLPELVKKREPRTITPSEYRAIIEAAPQRYRPLVALLPLTGLRIGEMLGLTWSAVNLAEGWLEVTGQVRPNTQTRAKRAKTPRSKARVPLTPEAVPWFEVQREQGHPSDGDWVFATGVGRVPSRTTIKRLYAAIGKATELDVHPHDMRHTAGSWLLDSGANLAVVSAFLRHSSVTTTSGHYTHVVSGADATAIGGLERYLNGDGTGTDSTH